MTSFFCRGWFDLDNISHTGAEWYVDCSDVVEIETGSRIPIWRTFRRIQWHVIPKPRVTLQSAVTWRIQWNDCIAKCHIARCCHLTNSMSRYPEATCNITGWKNFIRHIENRSSLCFIFCFSDAVWASANGSFRIVFDTLVCL